MVMCSVSALIPFPTGMASLRWRRETILHAARAGRGLGGSVGVHAGRVCNRRHRFRADEGVISSSSGFASPMATPDSVAPADFGRHPKAPPGREKGRDDRPRPHSPGWPCPWRYSQPLQRTISPRATVSGASSTAKAGWPFGSPGPLAGRCCARGFPPGRGARPEGRPRGLLHSTGCPPPAAGRVPLCGSMPCPASMRS